VRVHEKGNDESVQSQDLSENENQDHADEQPRLLRRAPHAGVADDADGETGRQTSQTDRETGTKLDEADEETRVLPQVVGDEHRHDETVDGNDTSHNDGNDVLDDQVRPEDTHGRDANTRLGSAVGSTEAGEDDGGGAAHRTEEGGVNGTEIARHCGRSRRGC